MITNRPLNTKPYRCCASGVAAYSNRHLIGMLRTPFKYLDVKCFKGGKLSAPKIHQKSGNRPKRPETKVLIQKVMGGGHIVIEANMAACEFMARRYSPIW